MDDFGMDTTLGHPDWFALLARARRSGLLFEGSLGAMVARLRGGVVYLATPYSKLVVRSDGGFDAAMSEAQGALAAEWQLRLALCGISAFSPIGSTVAMLREDNTHQMDPLSAEFWGAWCRPFLAASNVVVVPKVPGWDQSLGVWHEVVTAIQAQSRVVLLEVPHV
jgi:hypothetical protein